MISSCDPNNLMLLTKEIIRCFDFYGFSDNVISNRQIFNLLNILFENKNMDHIINAPFYRRDTLLHTACRYKIIPIIVYLKSKGANVNATNFKDETPLHLLGRTKKY